MNSKYHAVFSHLNPTVPTQDIDFNAADTEVAAALEALPNIGSVDVTRKGPDGQLGYSWSITFVDNPGYFPAGSGDVSLLSPDYSGLVGDDAGCFAMEVRHAGEGGAAFQTGFCAQLLVLFNYSQESLLCPSLGKSRIFAREEFRGRVPECTPTKSDTFFVIHVVFPISPWQVRFCISPYRKQTVLAFTLLPIHDAS